MAERIMLRLGDFDFEIATAAYQQYVARQGARQKEKGFDIFGERLENKEFRMFRARTGYGCDFRTMCIPEVVLTEKFYYDVMSAQ